MIDQILEAGGVNAASLKALKGAKLTKSGKVRKESNRKGQPTCYSDFVTKISETHAEEFAAFKAANPDVKQGAIMKFVGNYKKEHNDEYLEFEKAWKEAHPISETQSVAGDTSETPDSQEMNHAVETPAAPPAPVAPAAAVASTKPKKQVKKATITTEVVSPSGTSTLEEFLPFTIDGNIYLRMGSQRPDGNHLWSSGHLWKSDKGKKGKYYGELSDGSINKSAKEPSV